MTAPAHLTRRPLPAHVKHRRTAAPSFGSQSTYFASSSSGDGTQPSLPSSSLTFHQILSFSPVGYRVVPGSRSRTILDLLFGCSYSLPGLAMVTDCWTLSVLAS